VVDDGLVNGESKPLLIYSEQGDEPLAAGA
jgi:ATP-dependent Clp protease ATP-binding subunit ClpX